MLTTTLRRYLRYTRKHKRIIILSSTLSLIVLGSLGYIGYKVQKNENGQKDIVAYLENNYKEQQIEKIKTHSIAIRQKIDSYKKLGNEFVDSNVLNLYTNAYKLALDGDKTCYMLEVMGDDMKESYRQGYKDGKKELKFLNHSF